MPDQLTPIVIIRITCAVMITSLVTGCDRSWAAAIEKTVLVAQGLTSTAPVPTVATPSLQAEYEFAIYRVSQHTQTAQLKDIELSSHKFMDNPTLSIDDIVTYWRETHEIELTASAFDRIKHLNVPVSGLPFVVFVGHDPIYSGAFWTMASSLSFDGVTIWMPMLKERKIQIKLGYPDTSYFQGEDPRSDPRILSALKKAGKLKWKLEEEQLTVKEQEYIWGSEEEWWHTPEIGDEVEIWK